MTRTGRVGCIACMAEHGWVRGRVVFIYQFISNGVSIGDSAEESLYVGPTI
jgi:hypothetical protein